MKQVLIIGSGLAGCQTAYQLLQHAPDTQITILCKGAKENCNSWLAQGGIACAIHPQDHWLDHLHDTLQAGCNHNHPQHSELLVRKGPATLQALIAAGLQFDRDASGCYALGLEGAHRRQRILHCGGDQTGRIMTDFFHRRLAHVNWLQHAQVTELLTQGSHCYGLRYLDQEESLQELTGDSVVLATGGLGGLYPLSTNDSTLSGDGAALALRQQIPLQDMEFMQFHPTLLTKNGRCYGLISEAVRGAGAILVDQQGQPIMAQRHPQKDLAPRDIVARALADVYAAGQEAFLDISPVVDFQQHFPQITANLDRQQIPFRETGLIPVRPGAHFMMGGIATDAKGQTSLTGLYAVGEAACTGVHGANRLASNSLLECLVFGQQVANAILTAPPQPPARYYQELPQAAFHLPSKSQLQQKAWQALGIKREPQQLSAFLTWLANFQYRDLPPRYQKTQIEIANLCLVAESIATAALHRPTSLGAHAITTQP